MLNKKLQTDQWNEMCYQLLKLMTKQRKNPGSGRIVGIKSLSMLLGVNTAKVRVTAVKHNLLSKIYSSGINNIFDGPYIMIEILILTKPETTTKEAVHEHTIIETYKNTIPEKCAYFDTEAEVIYMILSGIGDDIYSTVDAYTITIEMWIAIERLQHDESLNKQDVKTNIFWVFDMDKGSYHKLFDILKQYQNEVNEIRAEKLAKNANPLTLVATTQQKPKQTKDYAYHKEKMMLCKQEEKGVPLSAHHGDWLNERDEEPDEHELEVHYMYMSKIQEVFVTPPNRVALD
ncbi:hypothetical protein Tco_0587937 [Tanacetum coccineum]